MALLLAFAAAGAYAAAMVLQHHGATGTAPELSLRPGLVTRLMRQPLWLIGVAANLAGYALRFAALGRGSLLVVQPVLTASLLLALPASARWHGQRLTRSEWAGVSAIAGGLALFFVTASPSTGRSDASGGAWLVTSGACAAVAGAFLVSRARLGPATRTAALAGAGGILLALTAALTKTTAVALRADALGALTRWPPYALALIGAISAIVVQSAFAAGPLSDSLPVLMVVEPLASMVIGAALFGETLAGGLLARGGEATGLALIVVGVLLSARSPVIAAPAGAGLHLAEQR